MPSRARPFPFSYVSPVITSLSWKIDAMKYGIKYESVAMIITKSNAAEMELDTVEKINSCPSKFVTTRENTGVPFSFSFKNAGINIPCFAA
ncbi:hypothetical protein D3C84_1036080 [compost metagenome]